MVARRLPMREIKEVLRLKWEYGSSSKQIAKSWTNEIRDFYRGVLEIENRIGWGFTELLQTDRQREFACEARKFQSRLPDQAQG